MTVKEMLEKLSKLDPDLECFALDSNANWCRIIDVWGELDDERNLAYFEISSLGLAELP